MNTSDNVNELMAALASAQGEMSGAAKDSINPHFRASYSDLASVIAAIRAPFAKHGLCYIQGPGQLIDGVVVVTTRIGHTSGQWVESSAHIPIGQKVNAQTYGSAVTYGRRYGLQALAGVPSVDDDGNAASEAPVAAPPVALPKLAEQQVATLQGLLDKCPDGTAQRFLGALHVDTLAEVPAARYDWATGALRNKIVEAEQ